MLLYGISRVLNSKTFSPLDPKATKSLLRICIFRTCTYPDTFISYKYSTDLLMLVNLCRLELWLPEVIRKFSFLEENLIISQNESATFPNTNSFQVMSTHSYLLLTSLEKSQEYLRSKYVLFEKHAMRRTNFLSLK